VTGHPVIGLSASTSATPVLLHVVGPPGSGKSLLIVALTSALRRRGFRVGSVEARTALDGSMATVLTTGSGARVTLPGTLKPGELASRAAVLDPALDLLLAEGFRASIEAGVPAVEIIEEGSAPLTPSTELLAVLTRGQLARAFAASGPADDLGLAAVIEERLLGGRADASSLARAAEAPIESPRRLLERAQPAPSPSTPRARGWRRWLGG
jgi:molybdopterin-guanine dinucleotide biosynthesis protein